MFCFEPQRRAGVQHDAFQRAVTLFTSGFFCRCLQRHRPHWLRYLLTPPGRDTSDVSPQHGTEFTDLVRIES